MLAALSALLLSAVLAEERIHIQDLPGLGFGGVVEDFDVRTATPADGSVLQRELERRHVLVFRNQSLTPADEIAFLSAYGDAKNLIDFSGTTCTPSLYAQDAAKSPLMAPPEPQRSCSVDGYPTLRKIGTATSADGTPVAMKASIGYEWHADSEGHANTMFYCLQTPDFGSDTHFVSAFEMHDRLSPEMKTLAEEIEITVSQRYTGGGPAAVDAACGLRMNSRGTRVITQATKRRTDWQMARHTRKLVDTHPTTNRKYIKMGAKDVESIRLKNGTKLDFDASQQLMDQILTAGLGGVVQNGEFRDLDIGAAPSPTLFNPRAVYSHKWRVGDLVLFDNRGQLHSTTPLTLYGKGGRLMHHAIQNIYDDDDADQNLMATGYYHAPAAGAHMEL